MAMLLCFGTADAWRRQEQLIKIDDIDPRTEHVQRRLKSSSKKTKSQNTAKSSKKSKAGSLLQTSQNSDTQEVEEMNEQVKDIELELEEFFEETESDLSDEFGIISPVRDTLPN
jgi:translation initiation factor 2 alpha subunit (eIF-2alpha)